MTFNAYNHNGTCLGTFDTEKDALACAKEYRYQTANASYVEEISFDHTDLKDYAKRLRYELSEEDCAEIIATSYEGETASEAVNDYLNAFER